MLRLPHKKARARRPQVPGRGVLVVLLLLSLACASLSRAAASATEHPERLALQARLLDDLVRGRDVRDVLQTLRQQPQPAAAVPAAARHGMAAELHTHLLALAPLLGQLPLGRLTLAELSALEQAYQQVQALHLLLEAHFHETTQHLAASAVAPSLVARQQRAMQQYQAAIGPLLAPLAAPLTHLRTAPEPAVLLASEDYQREVAQAVQAMQAFLTSYLQEVPRPILRLDTLPARPAQLLPRLPSMTPTIQPSYAQSDAASAVPVPADLAGTSDAPLQADIVEQARLLGYDYVRLYEFVRNEIRTEWYAGAMKGALGTLRQKSGNAVDQASLLIALLRASSAPARYVHGVIRLSAEQVMQGLGLTESRQVSAALTAAGIAYKPVVQGGQVAAFEVESTWVAARVPYTNYRGAVLDTSGPLWIPLLPAIKQLHVVPATRLLQSMGLAVESLVADYLAQPQDTDIRSQLEQTITAYLRAHGSNSTYAQQLGAVSPVPVHLDLLPTTPPVPVMAVTAESASLDESMRQRVRFVARAEEQEGAAVILDHTVALSELAGERLTLSYFPATVDDQQVTHLYGGLDVVPAYLIQVLPQLKRNGQQIAVATAPLDIGVPYRFEIHLLSPAGTESVQQIVQAGAYHAIGLHTSEQTLLATERQDPTDSESMAAGLLARLAHEYSAQWRQAEEEFAGLLDVALVRPWPSVTIVSTSVRVDRLFGQAQRLAWEGVTVDAALRLRTPFARGPAAESPRDWMRLSALQGSTLEHRLFEQLWLVPSISAEKGLQLARARGDTIHRLEAATAATLLASLQHPPAVLEHIAYWLERGMTVEVPAAPLRYQAWSGSVWRVEDPRNGASGYFISGGLAGGATSEDPTAWALRLLAEAFQSPYTPAPNRDPHSADSIAKLVDTDAQSAEVTQALPHDLAVRVRDRKKAPVQGALVTFRITGGAGCLQECGQGAALSAMQVDVPTDARGIAAVKLILGQKTSENMVYARRRADDEHLTQASYVRVDAAVSGSQGRRLSISEPFSALAYPRAPVLLQFTSTNPLPDGGGFGLLGGIENGWITVRAVDDYDNPVSNVPVEFTSSPQPLEPEQDCAFAPTSFIGRNNRASCPVASQPAVYGECGNRPYSDTTTVYGVRVSLLTARGTRRDDLTISAPALPALPFRYYITSGCTARGGSADFTSTVHLYLSPEGDNIHAARIGTAARAPLSFTLYQAVRHVGYQRVQASGRVEPIIQGDPPASDGTCVNPDPMAYREHGNYVTYLRTDIKPGLNRVRARVKNHQDGVIHGVAFEPVTGVRLRLQAIVAQQIPADVSPGLVYLDEYNRTRFVTHIPYAIEPADYQASTVEVDLFEDGVWTKTLHGSARHGMGYARLLERELLHPLRTYAIQLVLNRGTASEVRSTLQRLPLRPKLIQQAPRLLHVKQDVDVVNERSCVTQTEFRFVLSEEARVSLVLAQKHDTHATTTLLDNKLFAPGEHTIPLFLHATASAATAPTLVPGEYRYALTAVATNRPPEDTLTDPSAPLPELPGCPTVADPEDSMSAAPDPPPANQDAMQGEALVEYIGDRVPVGRTLVQDVDIANGNLVLSRTDVQVPGRGVPLAFRRTYSNNSSSKPGALGIGWQHNYQASLELNACGEVLVASDAGTVRFAVDVNSSGQSGWQPLKGYHGSLRFDGSTGTYDFYSTNGTRYHFQRLFEERQDFQLVYIQDTNGNATRLGYDPDDALHLRLLTVEDAARRMLSFHYEERVFDILGVPGSTPVITRIDGPDGIRLSFDYDEQGNLSRAAREGQSRVETYSYLADADVLIDPNTLHARLHGRLASVTDPNGHSTSYAYATGLQHAAVRLVFADATGRQQTIPLPSTAVTRVRTPASGVTQFQYDVPQRRTTVLNGRGLATTYTRNSAGAVVRVQDPVGGSSTTTWLSHDILPASRTDARGVTTAYTYDTHGNLLTETVDGLTTTYTYSLLGSGTIKNRPASVTNRNGHTTRFIYDARGNLLRLLDAAGGRTEHTYAANGDRVSSSDANGNVTRYAYDRYGNQTLLSEPLGRRTETVWNSRGLPLRRTDALGRSTDMHYDTLGRLVRRVDALGQEHQWHYDAVGNVLSETDEAGRTTLMQYDAANRPVMLQNAAGARKTMAYDLQGNKIRDTDYRGHVTTYIYDAGDRLVQRLAPLGRVSTMTYDAVGNMLSETDALGRQTVYTYDAFNRRLSMTDALGGVSSQRYDGMGNVVAQTDANGHTTTMVYDSLERLVQRTDPLGGVTAYEYDANGNRSAEIDANGRRRTVQYDALNRRRERTDALGQSTTYEYDAVDNLVREIDARRSVIRYDYDRLNRRIAMVDAAGFITTSTYDPVGNRTTERLPNGNVIVSTYDALNRLTERTDTLGLLLRYDYDADGNRLAETDANGQTTVHTYDALSQLVEQVFPAARQRLLTYDLVGNRTAETDANGHTTLFAYDARNRLSTMTDALGHTVTRTYDAVGNRRTETDQRGATTTFVYDARNRLVQTRYPLALETQITYDPVGNKRSERDKRGTVTTYTYDQENRLLSTVRAGVTQRTLGYDAVGNLIFETDANDNTAAFLYDARNLRVRESRPLAAITEHTYDAMGDRVQSRDPEGNRTRFVYDRRRRLLETTNGAGETTLLTYDGNGNRLSRQRPGRNIWTYTYDAANRLIAVTDPSRASTQYTYDGNGNRLSQTDANGHITTFAYDALNRLIRRHEADGATAVYVYDAVGNRLSATDANGQTVRHTYDALNRLRQSRYDLPVTPTGDDLTEMLYTYDANNNILQVLETYSGASATRLTTRTYDALDRVLDSTDADGQPVRSTYDPQGNRLSMTAPDGQVTQYAFDALNRLSGVFTPQGVTEYVYDRASRLIRTTYPTGTTARQVYDGANRVTRLTHLHQTAPLTTYSYTYDANGNRTTERVVQGGSDETTTYAYDAADRLQSVAYPDRTTTYTYDGTGNRLTEKTRRAVDSQLLADKTYRYNDRNQLTSVQDQIVPEAHATYAYDATGNRTGQTVGAQTTTYVYDARNQLRQLRQSGVPHGDFHYDWQGLRVRKSTNVETVRYVHDGTDMLLVSDDAGAMQSRYIYGSPGQLLLHEDLLTGPQYALADALGSIVALNRPDGSLQTRAQYDAWGQTRASVGYSTNRLGFTGHEYDADSGLYYAKARYYDPLLGVFLSPDLVAGDPAEPMRLHPYLYALANPALYIDLDGQIALLAGLRQVEERYQIGTRLAGLTHVGLGVAISAAGLGEAVAASPTGIGALPGLLSLGLGFDIGAAGVRQFISGVPQRSLVDQAINTLGSVVGMTPAEIEGVEVMAGMGLLQPRTGGLGRRETLRQVQSSLEEPITVELATAHGLQRATGLLSRIDPPDGVGLAEVIENRGAVGTALRVQPEPPLTGQISERSQGSRLFDQTDFADEVAQIRQDSAVRYGFTGASEGFVNMAPSGRDTVRVFRVEGPGNTRLLIDENGNVEIPIVLTQRGYGPERSLFLNFGDESRAQEFLAQRLAQGHTDDVIKSFEVAKTFLEELRRIAVPQRLKKQFPSRPEIADPSKARDQFGLTAEQIERLRRVLVPGSGRQ
ncbi:MAG: RHS repeat-associated core domain-containing protein [Candidatus Tectimicrobiota bacterium]